MVSFDELVLALHARLDRDTSRDPDRYVSVPDSAVAQLARRLRKPLGQPRFVLMGGRGYGKSTALAELEIELNDTWDVCSLALDVVAVGTAHSPQEEITRQVMNALSGHPRPLLLLDGLDDPSLTDAARAYLSSGSPLLNIPAACVVVASPGLGTIHSKLEVVSVHALPVMGDPDLIREGPGVRSLLDMFEAATWGLEVGERAIPGSFLRQLAWYSGGVPAEFFHLVDAAFQVAYQEDAQSVERSHVERALDHRAALLAKRISSSDIEDLQRLADDPRASLPEARKAGFVTRGSAVMADGAHGALRVIPHPLLSRGHVTFPGMTLPGPRAYPAPTAAEIPQRRWELLSVELTNFRGVEHLVVPLRGESPLGGNWTCIAGINGSGKTSILQAICLALLGPKHATDLLNLGGIQRMRRTVGRHRNEATVVLRLRVDGEDQVLGLRFGEEIHSFGGDAAVMLQLWEERASSLLLSYGATRNLSEVVTPSEKGPEAQRQATLFDPLAQVRSAESILALGSADEDPVLLMLAARLTESVFGERWAHDFAFDGRFKVRGSQLLGPIDLPDGYRSSLAWMADLCAAWAIKNDALAATGDLLLVSGVVLIDEIDLHLHPELQRRLVERLRDTLPGVTFVVTTHSPLVLSSFHSSELVALDRNAEGGIRPLDREIFGFSADEVYELLMGTRPYNAVLETALSGDSALSPNDVEEYLTMSTTVDAEDARRLRARRDELLSKLGS